MAKARRRLRLVLDLGGVIVDHDNARMLDRLAALFDRPPGREALAAEIAASGVGVGAASPEEVFEALGRRHGSAASQADFLDAWSCHFTLKRDVFDFLVGGADLGPLVLCSNTNAAHWDFLRRAFALDRLGAAAVLSHQCGCEKPRPEIYRLAAAAQGREPSGCLFVDDLPKNVAAARELGFATHLFTDFSAFRAAALAARGL